mmetsp:Transcript_9667/g.29123  ORF Transcript_9667/g.29123 Transcript_9667/m.29123 type:complete len:161 (-) Transcript_9667:1140-1622(-)
MQRVLLRSPAVGTIKSLSRTSAAYNGGHSVRAHRSSSAQCVHMPAAIGALLLKMQCSATQHTRLKIMPSGNIVHVFACASHGSAARSVTVAKAQRPAADTTRDGPQQLRPLRDAHHAPTAAYLHLPFCKKKCFYCEDSSASQNRGWSHVLRISPSRADHH